MCCHYFFKCWFQGQRSTFKYNLCSWNAFKDKIVFRGLTYMRAENPFKSQWFQQREIITKFPSASHKALISKQNWICVLPATSLSWSPFDVSFNWILYVCVSMSICAWVPITTKSAENKISLTDIKETQEGRWSVLSHGKPHFSPRPVLQSSLTPTTILTSLLPPNHWVAHAAKCCNMSACPLTQDPSFQTRMSDVQNSFSFEDLDVWDLAMPVVRSNKRAMKWEFWGICWTIWGSERALIRKKSEEMGIGEMNEDETEILKDGNFVSAVWQLQTESFRV